MAIRTVVTRGFGNGTFNGTIALLVLQGYAFGVPFTVGSRITTLASSDRTFTTPIPGRTFVVPPGANESTPADD